MNPSSPAERKGVALYARIASLLRGRIHQGEWKRGDQLPPIPELCAFYQAGTITVRQALAELSAEGLVSSARGRGTFVTADVVSPRITRRCAPRSTIRCNSHPARPCACCCAKP
ncbi:GntR family transcriptional regulator [Burkholderia cepacia]|nr:GntR family transcriptional regulator [Burkholderia cepacia]